MNIEKQIEEIAKAMCGNCMANGNCATDDEPCGLECVYGYCAERLYCKGYRKQSEGEWERKRWIIFDSEKVGYRCSSCNTTWDAPTNFCPNCGAKMKGGAE